MLNIFKVALLFCRVTIIGLQYQQWPEVRITPFPPQTLYRPTFWVWSSSKWVVVVPHHSYLYLPNY